MTRCTRKEFLGLFTGRWRPAPEAVREEPGADEGLDSLWADFPDALLAEEARRLGLDPEGMGRAAMLSAVRRAMLSQQEPRNVDKDTDPSAGRPPAQEATSHEAKMNADPSTEAPLSRHPFARREGT
ncbi:MAG: hypothetical protein ACEB74_07025 [Desulfovibrio aminophilus]|jgi:hypothetical protein|uniref:hypothetical protein n=1 Tax=Desulfovibrio aminophilus TaxID=81425 RepID=UPI002A385F74|nr:hypothetical protein [Desulfovibrionaceae bacterium]